MDKKNIWWFIAAGGVEMIAVGVGFAIAPQYGWWVAGFGFVILAFALWRAHKAKKTISTAT